MKQLSRIFLGLIYLLFFCTQIKAANIDRAYKALYVYDYFKAKKKFYATFKRHPVEAAYGLALIYYRTDNPFHNYDSAHKYIEISRTNYFKLSKTQLVDIKNKYAVNDTIINRLRDSVQYKSFVSVLPYVKRNSIHHIDSFIAFQSSSLYLPEVMYMRDSCVFASVCYINSSQAYQQYIINYPESFFLHQAKLKLDKALYLESTPNHLPEEYEKFILDHPKNIYVLDAENNVFDFYIDKKDVKGLYKSIYKYPRNKNISVAWKLIYALSVPEYSPEALNDFLEKYPDFPFKQTIEQEIALLSLKLYSIKQDGRYGFIDSTGAPYVLPYLDGVEEFSEGLCAAEFNGKFGYINKTGEAVIPFKYENAESFKHGLAIVQNGGKSAIIDRTGNYIVRGYDDIADFSEGLAVVTKNGKQGAINTSGQLIIEIVFDKMGDFSEGLAYAFKNGKYGFIDKEGDFVIVNMFEWAGNFKNNLAKVKFNNKFGVINNKGDFILMPEYDHIEESPGNLFIVVKGIHYGFAESSGCMLTDLVFDYSPKLKATDLCDGKWMRVITDEYQNLMNINGKTMFPNEMYEEIYLPKNGLIRFYMDEKYGFIDEHTKQVTIRPLYENATDFDKDFAVVEKKDNVLLIDKSNKICYSDKVDDIEILDENNLLITKNGLFGLNSKSGKLLLNCEYSDIEKVSPQLLLLEKQGKMAYYNLIHLDFIWKEKGFITEEKKE